MIQLNYRDSRPIYEQVRDGLRRLVVSGAISPGDKLPSVRQLAASLLRQQEAAWLRLTEALLEKEALNGEEVRRCMEETA